MVRRWSEADARSKFDELLGQVEHGVEPVVVERAGETVAVLVSPEWWEQYQREAKERFFKIVDEIQARNVYEDPDEVERIVAEAVEEVRRERYEQRDA